MRAVFAFLGLVALAIGGWPILAGRPPSAEQAAALLLVIISGVAATEPRR